MIISQVVGPPNQPVTVTSIAGTTAQVISSAVLTVGGAYLSGKPFWIAAQGYVTAHGAAQTFAIGFQGRKYATSAFSGTQLGTGTASGTLTAATSYPWSLEAQLMADNTSGILTGWFGAADGVTPTIKAPTALAALISGVNFGSFNITGNANAANPLAVAQTPTLQFALTFTNSVSDTVETVSVTSFYAACD